MFSFFSNVDEREKQHYSSSCPLYPNHIYVPKKGKISKIFYPLLTCLSFPFKPLKILAHITEERRFPSSGHKNFGDGCIFYFISTRDVFSALRQWHLSVILQGFFFYILKYREVGKARVRLLHRRSSEPEGASGDPLVYSLAPGQDQSCLQHPWHVSHTRLRSDHREGHWNSMECTRIQQQPLLIWKYNYH